MTNTALLMYTYSKLIRSIRAKYKTKTSNMCGIECSENLNGKSWRFQRLLARAYCAAPDVGQRQQDLSSTVNLQTLPHTLDLSLKHYPQVISK